VNSTTINVCSSGECCSTVIHNGFFQNFLRLFLYHFLHYAKEKKMHDFEVQIIFMLVILLSICLENAFIYMFKLSEDS